MLTLLTRRDDLTGTHWAPHGAPGPDLVHGQVLLRVEHLALTSNVFTYGATGDTLGYWDYWPTGEPGWGCLPAWGTARVLAGDVPDVPVGSRLAGLLPLASHAVLQPERVTPTSLRDGTPHRLSLPAAYQHYARLPADPSDDGLRDEQLASLLRPLVVLAAMLFDAVLDFEPAPATVVLTSASSRTARAVARELAGGPRSIGLTSTERVEEVTATGLYDDVLAYDDLDGLATVADHGPAVVVDLAGRADLRAQARAALRGRTVRTMTVGATHGDGGGLRPRHGEEAFLAPERMRLRAASWGPPGLAAHLDAAWQRQLPAARAQVQLVPAKTRADVEAAYAEVLAGRCALDHGHFLTLPTH